MTMQQLQPPERSRSVPALPELEGLDGWRWGTSRGNYKLIGPDGWATRGYKEPDRAITEALDREFRQARCAPAPAPTGTASPDDAGPLYFPQARALLESVGYTLGRKPDGRWSYRRPGETQERGFRPRDIIEEAQQLRAGVSRGDTPLVGIASGDDAGPPAPGSTVSPGDADETATQLRAHGWTWGAETNRGEHGYLFRNQVTAECCWYSSLAARLAADARTPELYTLIGAGWAPPPLGDPAAIYRRPPGLAEYAPVPLARVVRGRYQPRKQFDESELEELAESIRQHGVIDPIVVFVNERAEYELIAGERRTRAAKLAGLAEIPARIIEADDATIHKLSVFENIQRANLNPVEEGQAFERLYATMSEAALSRELGRPRSYISQRRSLARAAPEVQASLLAGEIDFTRARALVAGAPGDHVAQRRALKQVVDEQQRGRLVREDQAERMSEQELTSRARKELTRLGWQINTKYLHKTVVYGPGERPRVWTGTEIAEAIRASRRPTPPAVTAYPPVSDADRRALVGRGYTVTEGEFAPWVYVHGEGVEAEWLHPTEIAGAAERARDEIEALRSRFATEGWELRQDSATLYCAWDALSQQGRREHRYGWDALLTLIGQIERGEQDAAAPPERIQPCAQCGKNDPARELYQRQLLCSECRAAAIADEQARHAAAVEHYATAWRTWLDGAPLELLQLMLCESACTNRVLVGAKEWIDHDELARRVVTMARGEIAAAIVAHAASSAAGGRWAAWGQQDSTAAAEAAPEPAEAASGAIADASPLAPIRDALAALRGAPAGPTSGPQLQQLREQLDHLADSDGFADEEYEALQHEIGALDRELRAQLRGEG